MTSDWMRITIGDLVKAGEAIVQTGPFGSQLHKHDYLDAGVAVIPTEAIGRGRIRAIVVPKISKAKAAELARHRLHAGDILFARRGAQATGLSAIVDGPHVGALCGTGALLLRVQSPDVDPHYLSLYLSSDFAFHWLRTHAVGAVMPNINTEIIKALPLMLPTIAEQRELSLFLGAVDNRIALLRETNATLEAIAQSLFKSWFVDFDPVRAKQEGHTPDGMDEATAALFPDGFEESKLRLLPRGWKDGVLGDVADTTRRQIQPEAMTAEMLYVGLEHIPRQSLGLDSWGTAAGLESAKSCFAKGDILFGKLRPYFHKVAIAPFAGVCSTDILVCKAKLHGHYSFTAMHLFSSELVAYAERLSNGAKMPRVNWKDLAAYELVVPPVALAIAFEEITLPMLEKITANVLEAQTLAALRDTLLPRLISGQLSLTGSDPIQAEAA